MSNRLRPHGAALLICAAACAPPTAGPPQPDAVGWLQSYLRLDTTNPPGGEGAAADLLGEILARADVAVTRLDPPSGRASLAAEIGPPGTDALLLLHHSDVVPAGRGWTHEPFSGHLEDGIVHGRGAVDSKGLGVAHLAAFLRLAERRDELTRRIVLFAAADEETGGREGVGRWLELRPEVFERTAVVLAEGGFNRAARGEVAWWGVEVAQKRPLWLDLEADSPEPLIRGLARLLRRPPEWRLVAPVRRHFEALRAGRLPGAFDVEGALAAPRPELELRAGLAVFVLDSIQVNVLRTEGGVARATLDVRLLPDADLPAVRAEVERELGSEVRISERLVAGPVDPSPSEGELWELFEEALPGPVVPYFLAGITDARYFRERGVPSYGFSPFALDGTVTRTVHAPDEHLPVAELLRGIDRVEAVLERWALSTAGAQTVR